MAQTKNLCAQIPLDLHTKVCEAREESGLTTAQYITNLLIEYYEMKKNGGNTVMANNSRTMAFQIPEDLFQRIKAHLERETARTGRKLTQREFALGLIEEALNEAERLAGASPSEDLEQSGGPQPQEEGSLSRIRLREDSQHRRNRTTNENPGATPARDAPGLTMKEADMALQQKRSGNAKKKLNSWASAMSIS